MHPIEHELRSLESEHEARDVELQQELARPHPDEVRVQRFKKEKLRLKDRMEELRAALAKQRAADESLLFYP